MRIKNKKGFALLEKNVVELVIAGLGIFMIFALAVYIFNIFSVSQDKRNAQTALDIIESKVAGLQEGKSADIEFKGPCKSSKCDWFLDAYGIGDIRKPTECNLLQSCLCMCQGNMGKDNLCYGDKVCKNFDVRGIVISPGQFVTIALPVGELDKGSYATYNRTGLQPNLNKFSISRLNGELTIVTK